MNQKGWVKKLFQETENWVRLGLIDTTQEERIKGYYAKQSDYSRLVNTITTLGSILVGLGILLFIASNWEKLSRPAKIFIIFSAVTLFNSLGYYFRYVKKAYLGLAEGFLLIGAFTFGAGIWLIAQMYQIHYNFSAGVLFWIIGIIPVVYLYRSWTILALSSVLGLIWLSSYQAYYFQRINPGFFVLLLAFGFFCYSLKNRFTLFMMVVMTAVWLGHYWLRIFINLGSFFEESSFTAHLFLAALYLFFGFLLYGAGILHARMMRFANFSFLYKFLGVVFISAAAYSLTFSHHYYQYSSPVCPLSISFPLAILILGSALILLGLYRSAHEKSDIRETKLLCMLLVAGVLALPVAFLFPAFASLSFNLVLFFAVLGFMYLGFLTHSEGIFRLSIIIFFIDVLSRYFDIFWKMMPRSLLFIFGGILLIAGAVFADRKRRELEEKMHKIQAR